jgi:hypothetical protein
MADKGKKGAKPAEVSKPTDCGCGCLPVKE